MSSVACVIAAAAAGAAAMRRNLEQRKQEELLEPSKPVDKSALVAVTTKLTFNPLNFVTRDDSISYPHLNEQILITYNKKEVPEESYAFTICVKFNTKYGEKYTLARMEQIAASWVRNLPHFEKGIEDVLNKRYNTCLACGADRYIVEQASVYEVSMDTDISANFDEDKKKYLENSCVMVWYNGD